MFDDLRSALQRLDQLLENAIQQAEMVYGSQAATDPYRGLRIDADEIERLLKRPPGTPLFRQETDSTQLHSLNWLKETFGLSVFDLDVILIALAPEIDLRYERLYAYLQDDITRKRPTIDLALNVLCPSAEAKLLQRANFAPDAPLIKQGLLQLIPDPHQVYPPILSYYLKIDEQIIHILLNQKGLDPRLAAYCQLITDPTVEEKLPLGDDINNILPRFVTHPAQTTNPLVFYFSGLCHEDRKSGAIALAAKLGQRLLIADLGEVVGTKVDLNPLLKKLLREALFHDAILYLDGVEVLQTKDSFLLWKGLLQQLRQAKGIIILSGSPSDEIRFSHGVIPVAFPKPDFSQRRIYWETHLKANDIILDDQQLDILANRFRLTSENIENAVSQACYQCLWRNLSQRNHLESHDPIKPILNDLLIAARDQSDQSLSGLAQKSKSHYYWSDLILPSDQHSQIEEICNQAKYRYLVYETWGFNYKLSAGKGLNVLFSGPPGTGKTMAAQVIANELKLDLYKIDLSQVVSKYIGETEKNLNRIFMAAETANAILLFDEADTLFGKRSEVRDAHDRYANIEVGYLLQKMEEYEGISILTTNFRQNLDEAFIRRLAFIVDFPFPNETSRRQIWEGIWPSQKLLSEEVDFNFLARQFKISGGNIKNIALAAAFLAAEKETEVTMEQILHATKREYQKMGKTFNWTLDKK
ncbi:MAG: AAA family ATPase [Crocosphaera sp.]